MTLKQVDYRTKENAKYKNTATEYILGDDLYHIDRYVRVYADGEKLIMITVSRNWDHEYLPDIYFDDKFGKGNPEFKIQTTAYGALNPEEIAKVIEGYNTALEAVKILTKNFC